MLLTNPDALATNNISEREIRLSVAFRKVTNGFDSEWGLQIHAEYQSATGAVRLAGQAALTANRDFVEGRFGIA